MAGEAGEEEVKLGAGRQQLLETIGLLQVGWSAEKGVALLNRPGPHGAAALLTALVHHFDEVAPSLCSAQRPPALDAYDGRRRRWTTQ